jgi:hypothetical protein
MPRLKSKLIQTILLLLVLLVVCSVYLLTTNATYNFGRDPSCYMGLAGSLANGSGYYFNGRLHTQYPPGFPLYLTFPVYFVGTDIGTLQRFIALTAIAALFVTFGYYVKRDLRLPLLPCALIVVSPTFYSLATSNIYSELPYILASVAFLWWFESLPAYRTRVVRLTYILGGVLLLLATLALRAIGIAMLSAFLLTAVTLGLRRNRADTNCDNTLAVIVLIALVGFAYVIAWFYWTTSRASPFYPGEFMHSYLTQIRLQDPHQPDFGFASLFTIVARIPANLLRETGHTAQLLSNIPRVSYRWGSPLIITTLCLCLVGLWKDFRRANPLAAWYTVCYVGILAIWPFDEHQRFVLPLFPLLLLFAAYAIGSIGRLIVRCPLDSVRRVGLAIGGIGIVVWLAEIRYTLLQLSRQDWMNGIVWVVLILICLLPRRIWERGLALLKPSASTWIWAVIFLFAITYSVMGAQAISRRVAENLFPDTTRMRHAPTMHAATWLAQNASPSDSVMAQGADSIHFSTGRLVIPFPVTSDPGRLRIAVMLTHPRFLVVNDPQEYPYFLPEEVDRLKILMQLFPDQLYLCHQYPGGRIFEFTEHKGRFR